MNVQPEIIAPVKKGQQMGTLELVLEDKILVSRPLVALSDIEEGDFFQRMLDEITMLFQ